MVGAVRGHRGNAELGKSPEGGVARLPALEAPVGLCCAGRVGRGDPDVLERALKKCTMEEIPSPTPYPLLISSSKKDERLFCRSHLSPALDAPGQLIPAASEERTTRRAICIRIRARTPPSGGRGGVNSAICSLVGNQLCALPGGDKAGSPMLLVEKGLGGYPYIPSVVIKCQLLKDPLSFPPSATLISLTHSLLLPTSP